MARPQMTSKVAVGKPVTIHRDSRGAAVLCGSLVFGLLISHSRADESWPALPEADALVTLPAQEWPLRPGPRTIEVAIHYPGGRLDAINSKTGLMLSLHNWGGTRSVGTANPVELARRYNVVALCVDYLQS